jgi:hypothetical protein
VHNLFCPHDAGEASKGTRTDQWFALPPFYPRRRSAVHSYGAKGVAIVEPQVAELGLADAHRIPQHGLEHWLQLAR